MSSEFNDIDQMFSEGLRDLEVTPPAHVWDNIKKGKRRGFLLYKNLLKISALLLLIAGASIAAYYFNETPTAVTSNDVVTSNDNQVAETPSTELNNTNTNKNSDAEISNDVQNANNTASSSTTKNTAVVNQKHNSGSSTKHQTIKTNQTIADNSAADNHIISDNTTESQEQSTKVESQNFDYSVPELISRKSVVLNYLIYPGLMQYVYSNKRLFKKYENKFIKDDEPVFTQPRYAIEILGGPSYASRKLYSGESDLRDASEKAVLSIQTGLRLSYNFNPKWSVQSGVLLENRNEKVKYSYSEEKTNLIQTPRQVTIYHPVLPPHNITVIDSSYQEETINHKYNYSNKYTSLNVPVLLGYTFGLGKLQYRLSAGTMVTVLTSNSANILQKQNTEIVIVPYRESTKLKTSALATFGVQIPLSSNCSFLGELSSYYNITNRLRSESLVKQRNFGYNLSAGIRVNLLKK